MKTTALLFLLHLAGGLPGWMVFGDVVVEEPQQFPWALVMPVGVILIVVISIVVLWIQKIKDKNSNHKN